MSRWKTSARIDAINEEHAERDRIRQLASRRWGTLHDTAEAKLQLDSSQAGTLSALQNEPTPAQGSSFGVHDDRLPAWLLSLIFHMVLVLILAFVSMNRLGDKRGESLTVQWSPADSTAMNLQLVDATTVVDPTEQELNDQFDDSSLDTTEVITSAEVEIPNPTQSEQANAAATLLERMTDRGAAVALNSRVTGGQLGDRSQSGRAAAIATGDVSDASEAALDSALRWLANHQHNDGGWSFRLDDPNGPCQGQCKDGRKNPDDAPIPRTAATGLAILAFLGAGSTHFEGPYAGQVQRGIYYLRSQARDTTLGVDLQNGSMYGHGIATLALAEAYVLTGDKDLEEFARGTTFFCSGAQHSSGGWGYRPAGPPDITLTAWQVIALKTAETKGIRIPTEVIPKAKDFVASLATQDLSQYGYKSPPPTIPTTAIGLLLQLYFGYFPRQTGIREGIDLIASTGPSESNVYYNYYAMLLLHHARHRERMRFARELQEYLVRTQERDGHLRGSWHFADRYGSVGGRLYTTALCALILETPYRYVPMHGDAPFEL